MVASGAGPYSAAMAAYRFVPLTLPALEALVARDLATAGSHVGVELTPYIEEHHWLWVIRLEQVHEHPADLGWIARPALPADGPDSGRLVGHLGYHGSPDEDGEVEVAYSVDPAYRRRGHATAMLGQEIQRLQRHPQVRSVRASIDPDNVASRATLVRHGFVHVGEQWDEEDGLELVFRLRLREGPDPQTP